MSFLETVLEYNNESSEITLEDYLDLLHNSLMNISEDEEINTVNEGANIDITNSFIEMRRSLRALAKESRKELKDRDYNAAEKTFDKMIGVVDDAEKEIRNIDSGKISNVLYGFFAAWIIDGIEITFPLLFFIDSYVQGTSQDIRPSADGFIGIGKIINAVAKAAGKGTIINLTGMSIVKSIVDTYRSIKTFLDEIKNSETSTGEALNAYRNRIIRFLNEYKSALKSSKKDIAKIKAKNEDL